MQNNKKIEKDSRVTEQKIEKRPDSAAGLLIQAHLKISDPVTGKVFLKTRG